MQLRYLSLLGVAAGAAHAAPEATQAACAQVSASSAAQAHAATPTVAAKLAYDCLTSAPLHKADALKLVNSVQPWVNWQTTVIYLKNPPSGYQEPAVDLDAAFATIKDKINNGSYANEYEFEFDLFTTFNLAHDGHFRYSPNLISAAITFTRGAQGGVGLVSVSLDGSEVPQIYTRHDIQAYVGGKTNVSPISQINGEDAATYLENYSQKGQLQDPDALYNSMFFSKPFAAESPGWEGYFAGSGRFGFIYQGLNTTLTYQNGTKQTIETVGNILGDWKGITDGQSLYAKYCSGTPPPAPTSVPTNASTTTAPAPTSTPYTAISSPTPIGYPKPVIVSHDDIVSGYYLNSTRNSDVAVLVLLEMESESPAEFQAVIQDFFADAVAAGKKKLVLDLSANPGGYILQGYDTFRQMFPHIVQDGYSRWRSSEAFQTIAAEFETILRDYNPKNATFAEIENAETSLYWRYDFNLTNQPFPSEPNKVGPYHYNEQNYTQLMRWNVATDPLTTANETFGLGMYITGYNDRQNFTQPFAAEDIIVLYDGYCASTCTLLSEFLTTQAGVSTLAIGGRPKAGPMQAIGGTKGANNADYTFQNELAQFAYNHYGPKQRNSSEGQLLEGYLDLYPYYRATDTSINLRDNILPGHLSDQTPAQFLYQPADCRIYYEPNMTTDIANMWEAAADVTWGSKNCAYGSLANPKRTLTAPPQRVADVPERITDQKEFLVPEKSSMWLARNGRKVAV